MVSKTSRQKEEYWVTCGEEVLPKDSRVMMIQKVFDPESIKPVWVAWVEILKRIEEQPYHWAVGRTRFQKIAYFASEQGLPLGLDYQKGSYGPFSPALKALVTRLINNGLIREQRLGKMFAVKVGQTYQDAYKAFATYLEETRRKWRLIQKR